MNLLSTSLEGNLTWLYRVELKNSNRNIVPINMDNTAVELFEAERQKASAQFIVGVP